MTLNCIDNAKMQLVKCTEREFPLNVQCNPDLVTHLVCEKSVTKSRGVTK